MATDLLFDISGIDRDRILFGPEEIRTHNPHRGDMELLDGIIHFDGQALEAMGFHDLAREAFWTAGHIPGYPIFPGALMIEAAAQLSSFCYRERFGPTPGRFFGFGGIDKVKFRGIVRPGERLYLLCTDILLNRRLSRFRVQGLVHDNIVFEGEIIGVAMPLGNNRPADQAEATETSA